MSGHSKWATIKRKKAATDAKRGKIFTKLIREITVAARDGGGDPNFNPRLRLAVETAKSGNMPADNITRAIKKGTGDLEGVSYEEIVYEGYANHGVAVMCDIMTDNRNRTAPEIRKMFEIHNGNLGATNCVGWIFNRKGLFLVLAENVDEEQLIEVALQAGADDISESDGRIEVTCEPEDYTSLSDALRDAEIDVESKQVTRIPTNTIELDAQQARQVMKLLEALDDHDDVQNVSANFNISNEVLAELQAES